MTSHLPWAVQILVAVVLILAGLGLLAMFLAPMMGDSEEAGVNAHGWDEPTLPEGSGEPAAQALASDPAVAPGLTGPVGRAFGEPSLAGWDRPLREAMAPLFARYRDLARDPSVPSNPGAAPGTELEQVEWLCDTAIRHLYDHPLDKLNRWMGFTQGILAVNGLLDVQAERNLTRPVFHRAYRAMGIEPPVALDAAVR